MISEIKKMKDIFKSFESLIEKINNKSFTSVSLNKSAPKSGYGYYGKSSKGVDHDFVRIYDYTFKKETIRYVFLFTGDIFSKDLNCKLVMNDNSTDYIIIDEFKKSLKEYIKFIVNAIDLEMDIDEEKLLNKFFKPNLNSNEAIDLIKEEIAFDESCIILDNMNGEIISMKINYELDKTKASSNIKKSKAYKEYEKTKIELNRLKDILDRTKESKNKKVVESYNKISLKTRDISKFKIESNKKLNDSVKKSSLSPIEKKHIINKYLL